MSKKTTLTETLDTIKEETEGTKITFGEMLDILNSRGFGPLLIAPAVITILPTGAIPTIPTICAVFIILVSSQILIGRHYPWMPERLKGISFNRQTYRDVEEKIRPYTKKIDKLFKPRLQFLTGNISQSISALLCIGLAITMSLVELIPFLAALPAAAILMMGLSLSMKDGILMMIGYAMIGVTGGSIYYLWDSF